jgi:protein-S-isoprenylcysteine O-methyltransferase Ste14
MSRRVAHSSFWETADVVFGSALLGALALQWAAPLSLPGGLFTPVFAVAGTALIVAGVALIVLARRELRRRGQPADPGTPTSALVTTGVFSVSRNPLYLGVVCLLSGIALVANLPWIFVLLLPALIACHFVLIAPEERYLDAVFGEEYQRYAASVHRWLGRVRRSPQFPEAQ